MKSLLNRLLHVGGYELRRILPPNAIQRLVEPDSYRRLNSLLHHYKVNHVLDVGAFQGQFGKMLMHVFNYQGKITSFEPVAEYYARLQQTASSFQDRWNTYNCALGDACTKTTIQIAGNAYSSSLLPMLPAHEAVAPESAYVGSQPITVATLDSIFETCSSPGENLYLKIDVQGFEKQVLIGAQQSLAKIETVQLELSLVPLYEGETLLPEMINYMQGLGYCLVLLIPGFANEATGELLQVDAVFHRSS